MSDQVNTAPEGEAKKVRKSRIVTMGVVHTDTAHTGKPCEAAQVREVNGNPGWAVSIKSVEELVAIATQTGCACIYPAGDGEVSPLLVVGAPTDTAKTGN